MNLLFIVIIAVICLVILVWWYRKHTANRTNPLKLKPYADAQWVVLYATQRGRAKRIADQTVKQLTQFGINAQVLGLDRIQPDDLINTKNFLIITSTFGSGQSPDMARKFEKQLSQKRFQAIDLSSMNYALVALGDKSFDRFCGFGRKLDSWLISRGARPLKPALLVNQMDKVALQQWQNWIETKFAQHTNKPEVR